MSGWISRRHMRSGGSLYEGGPKKRGPLRAIVATLRHSTSIFCADRVKLECGHEADSWGGVRAICKECGKAEGRPQGILQREGRRRLGK